MNKRVTRLMAPLLLLAFQQPSPAQEASSQELVVIDLRPKEEKDGIGLLELTGKCNKDDFRIADVATDPIKVETLRAALAEQLANNKSTTGHFAFSAGLEVRVGRALGFGQYQIATSPSQTLLVRGTSHGLSGGFRFVIGGARVGLGGGGY